MRYALITLSCLMCLTIWAGCGNSTGDRQEKVRKSRSVYQFNVAEAKRAVWPPPGDEPIERFDPIPTRQNYMAVLDMSGSMQDAECSGRYGQKADAARDALITWLDNVPRQANVGLVVFSRQAVSLEVPLGVDNRDRFKRAVMGTSPSGGTPLQSALYLAYQELVKRARYQNGYGEYRLVVITDGQHSSGEDPKPVVDAILSNPANPVQIYTIGFCIEDSALNQPGRIVYHSANNPDELKKGLDRVLAESTHFNADLIKEFEQYE